MFKIIHISYKMRNILIIVLSLFVFTSCEKMGPPQPAPEEEETPAKKTGIYVKFATESPFVSYTDNNPAIGSNMYAGVSYGPCNAGKYLFTAMLANGRGYPQQQYTLVDPAPGYLRTYTIRFYYGSELNRWLYTYSFVDSK
jgi:hypothetical protein